MAEPLQIGAECEEALDATLPFSVELWSAEGDRVEAVLGRVCNASLGFACYYGALREYVDRRVVLRNGDVVVATFNASKPG